jgi:NAD(P)-dependent dehydrogenase (short-subunit alcohol dehydrogenase family)
MKIQKSGKIVNIATSPGENKKHTYHIPKAGVIRMTQAFAVKLAEFNINVNSVSPNFTLTDRHIPGVCPEKTLEFYKERAPMGRFVTMEDVANAVLFFASEKSSIINGQDLVLDGGWSVHA